MASTVDSNINITSSTDNKHHILLIYLVHDDGYYGGGYHARFFKLMGTVGGESCGKMIDQAYESLEECVEDEAYIPFDIKNIRESVVFDLVECHDEEELHAALGLKNKRASYEELCKAVLQMREIKNGGG